MLYYFTLIILKFFLDFQIEHNHVWVIQFTLNSFWYLKREYMSIFLVIKDKIIHKHSRSVRFDEESM